MKNYLVVEAIQNTTTGEYENFKGYKEFQSKKSALKCAYERSQMITKKALMIETLVYDRKENSLIKSNLN